MSKRVTMIINPAFWPVAESKAIFKILIGGRGSGKSHFVGKQYLPTICATERVKVMAMRKVATSIRLSIWPTLLAGCAEIGIHVDTNKTERTISFPNGSLIACAGADDPEKIKSLEGFDVVWLEEATEFNEQDFLNLDAAIKSPRKEILATFNPVPTTPEYSHFLKSRFLDSAHPDSLVIKTTYRDNLKFLPPHYVASLEGLKETNLKLWEMWANGNYTTLEGVILDNWDVVDAVPEEGGTKFLGYGLDFGFSDDPAALVAVWRRGNDLYVREELYRTGMTNQDICAFLGELGVRRTARIVADSSEPKSIEEICRGGWNVHPAVKGADSVRAGIDRIRSMKLHVVRGSSNLVKELSAYSWRRNKDGHAIPEPVDSFNHGIDALRYAIGTDARIVRAGPSAGSLGI